MIESLKEEKISSSLTQGVVDFRASHPIREEERGRIFVPRCLCYGREVWGQAIAVLLYGQNPPLAGSKATGKDILVQNLAAAFGGPVWNIFLHVNIDASGLIGTDILQNEAVVFRPGLVYRCGVSGGSGVLNEINMARNEALAMLHGILDFRRTIDVPGYDVVHMDEGTRLVATINYEYTDIRELDEALTSRFACLQIPTISRENLEKLASWGHPGLKRTYVRRLVQLFLDTDRKCQSAQLSTRPLNLRGLLDTIWLMEKGLDAEAILDMEFTNKSFDPYKQNLVQDLIRARISKKLEREKLFTD